MTRRSVLQIVLPLMIAAMGVIPGEAVAVPPRRLARRGIIVTVRPQPAAVVPRTVSAVPPMPTLAPLPKAVPTTAAKAAPTPAQTPASTSAAAAGTPRAGGPEPARIPVASSMARPAGTDGKPAGDGASGLRTDAFSPDWLARHPQAWRPAGPAIDWWRVADEAAVAASLSQPVVAGGIAAAAAVKSAAAESAVGSDGLQSVLVLPAGHANQTTAPADVDWLPLGVFAILPPGGTQPHDYQQLAVDRNGVIRGSFFDPISDTTQPIAGTIDRSTLVATWTVGAGGSQFSAAVRDLAAASPTVVVSSAGQSRRLELRPLPRPE